MIRLARKIERRLINYLKTLFDEWSTHRQILREHVVSKWRYPDYPSGCQYAITRARINAEYFRDVFFARLKEDMPDLPRFVLEGFGPLSNAPEDYLQAQVAIKDWARFQEQIEGILPCARDEDIPLFREVISQLKQASAIMASIQPP